MTALEAVNYCEAVYSFMNPEMIKLYKDFDEAGVLAQVAAGPLKVFCRGNVDTLKTPDIPDDVTLFDLAPIHDPPYDRTLKQTKIILEFAACPCRSPLFAACPSAFAAVRSSPVVVRRSLVAEKYRRNVLLCFSKCLAASEEDLG
ncbi:hypothetical protein H6P81_016934 [Aristolochia fimbriata]|uniref:Uncharacterized protein n=1 Tax=Aristolochia fimbriata TaxID=158543 RepID=A0AAV7DWQ6_ARIFI|nr:hypothetical protein H6P81_016934 [Aristolochia fimbriata]